MFALYSTHCHSVKYYVKYYVIEIMTIATRRSAIADCTARRV